MLNRLLIVFSLVFLLSNCKTIDTQNRIEDEKAEYSTEKFIPEEQSQAEQNFEVVDSAQAAQKENEKIAEEVEEVEVPDRVFFDVDKNTLKSEAISVLNTQSEWLQSDPSIKIVVEGHCDERGTREYNIALGEKRALAVKNYLVSKGIESSRIKVISYGKERPAFVGSGEETWSKNRRSVTVVDQ